MEILRFEEAPTGAPKRKKSSRSFLALGLVATLFGISTAFASSTITINSDNKVNLGQGVVTVSGCDSNIGFKPVTKLSSNATDFQVTDFIIGYDWNNDNAGWIDTDNCDLKQMKITLYKDKVGGGVDLVTCHSTYGSVPVPLISTGGADLRLSKVAIGVGPRSDGQESSYVTKYKCSSDGSFYFLMDKSTGSVSGHTMVIHWPDQVGNLFKADTFDHITIESVSGETGLTGV